MLLLSLALYPFAVMESTFVQLVLSSVVISFSVLLLTNISALVLTLFNIYSNKFNLLPAVSLYFLNNQIYPIVHGLFKSSDKRYISATTNLIKFSNIINKKLVKRYSKDEILVLLPHCLQDADCKHKVTYDIDNCLGCGKCVIGAMKQLSDEFNVNIRVATGGTLARRIIVDSKPKLILAVACHRDLIEGIKDISFVPIVGILNERPNGPCFNTTCNPKDLRNLLVKYIK